MIFFVLADAFIFLTGNSQFYNYIQYLGQAIIYM